MLNNSQIQSTSKEHSNQLVELIMNVNLGLCNTILDEYLTINQNQQIMEYLNQFQSNTQINNLDLNSLTIFIYNLVLSCFNVNNLSQKSNEEIVDSLISNFNNNNDFEQFLVNLVKLSKHNRNLVRMASNAIYLLVKMNIQLFYLDFSWIQIEDTDINQGNLAGCNLDNSQFTNVNISGLNLNGASLLNAKWLKSSVLEELIIFSKEGVDKIALISKNNLVVSYSKKGNIVKVWNYLNGKLIKCINPKSKIYSFDLSSNGLIALGSNSIYLYKVQTGKMTNYFGQLNDEDDVYFILDFSIDGSLLATGNYNNEIKIWKCESKQIIQVIQHCPSNCLSIKNNCNYVISDKITYFKKSLLIWNIQNGNLEKQQDGAYDDINCFYYDPEFLVIGTGDPEIQVWDKDWKELPNLSQHSYGALCITYEKEQKILATGSYDRNIILWNSNNWEKLAILKGHLMEISNLQFTQNGLKLISCSKDKTIRVWDLKSIFKQRSIGNSKLFFNNFSVSKDERQLFIFSYDNSQKNLYSFPLENRKIYFDFQSNRILETIDNYDTVQFERFLKNKYIITSKYGAINIKMLGEENSKIIRIPTVNRLYRFGMLTNEIGVAIEDKYIQYTFIKNQSCAQNIQVNKKEQEYSLFSICQKNKIIAVAQFSILKFWQLNKVIFKFDRKTQISLIQFSNSGKYLLLQGKKYELEIWSLNNRRVQSYLEGHTQSTICAQFTPNEKIIVTSGYCFTMRFWDVITGTQLSMTSFEEAYASKMLISNQDGDCKSCKLYITNSIFLQIWNLGDCNVNQFEPICYKQYSTTTTPFTADYTKVSGAIITNQRNQSIMELFQYKINQSQQFQIQD